MDAELFFSHVQPGDRFRFRVRPGLGHDIHSGLVLTCTGPVQDHDHDRCVPFRYPDGARVGSVCGDMWRSACDRHLFEILT